MRIKSETWVKGFLILVISFLAFTASSVALIDPYMHYHYPKTDQFYYPLDNPRSITDGIIKHFPYDAIITGSSMTENFRTSEAEELWGGTFIKIPIPGASYKEINDNLEVALRTNPDVRLVIRGLDTSRFLDEKDDMRLNPEEYPTYLYDDNLLNDVKYLLNWNAILKGVIPILLDKMSPGFEPGLMSFDMYRRWKTSIRYGLHEIFPEGVSCKEPGEPVYLAEGMEEQIRENIRQNVTELAEEYPDVTFYLFFTPYSIRWWKGKVESGMIYRQLQAEKIIIQELLKCENIKIYSFNNLTGIVTDLNNYRDSGHYGEWINSMMLQYMHEGRGLLTMDNYEAYLEEEAQTYTSFDYSSLANQEDYEQDSFAAYMLYKNGYGMKPREISRNPEYNGLEYDIDDISLNRFIAFEAKRVAGAGTQTVSVYDEKGKIMTSLTLECAESDREWHSYYMDVTDLEGKAVVVFYSDGIDNEQFVFRKIVTY